MPDKVPLLAIIYHLYQCMRAQQGMQPVPLHAAWPTTIARMRMQSRPSRCMTCRWRTRQVLQAGMIAQRSMTQKLLSWPRMRGWRSCLGAHNGPLSQHCEAQLLLFA